MRDKTMTREFSSIAQLPMGRLAAGLIQFGQQEENGNLSRFLNCLMVDQHPEANTGLFALCKSMICSWAGLEDLSRPDADAIECSRKICDAMGWLPTPQ